ncbi:hypothetical protein V6N12_061074 [Hibiscus sabdariffa]|uniref:Selenoprotein F n=1 Tax=Hibiscus sabdariffa TaxID=183260 RepID=A0ABR2DW01_9ROSI
MRKLVFYPEIIGFIEEEKSKFPAIKVQYIFNSPPKLIMLNEEGQHKETIRLVASSLVMLYPLNKGRSTLSGQCCCENGGMVFRKDERR